MNGQSARPKRSGNIVIMRSHSKGTRARTQRTILQADLEELIAKRHQVKKLGKELDRLESDIRAALRSGAQVEDGVHTAEMLHRRRDGYRVSACAYYELRID